MSYFAVPERALAWNNAARSGLPVRRLRSQIGTAARSIPFGQTLAAAVPRIFFGKTTHVKETSPILIPGSQQNAAILTIVLAFAGYLVTFLGAHMMARRADRRHPVNERLNEHCGPLFVATVAENIAYCSLILKEGKTQCHLISNTEIKEWMLWITTIFMPLNAIHEKIIIKNAHLIVEEEMPHCLPDFMTHVVVYKAVLAKWAEGDCSGSCSNIGWPLSLTSMSSALTRPSRPNSRNCCTKCASRAYRRLVNGKKKWAELRKQTLKQVRSRKFALSIPLTHEWSVPDSSTTAGWVRPG